MKAPVVSDNRAAEQFSGPAGNGQTAVNERLTESCPHCKARPKRQREPRQTETAEYAAMLRRLIHRYAERVAMGDIEDLETMLAMDVEFSNLIRHAVTSLRLGQDYSWTDIARAAGVTRQAAQQRWGRERG